jgi:DNA-binding NtrC family response regulator
MRTESARGTILIVDDEPGICDSLSIYLKREGYEAHTAASAEEALRMLEGMRPDVALVDLRLPGMDGLTLLKRIRTLHPDVETVLITAFGDADVAIQATQDGAHAYVPKPFDLADIGDIVRRSLEKAKVAVPSAPWIQDVRFSPLIGESAGMKDLRDRIAGCAGKGSHVIFVGEIGSGREAAARLLHSHLPPGAGPFHPYHCGALDSEELASIIEARSDFGFFSELSEFDSQLLESLLGSVPAPGTGGPQSVAASLALPLFGSAGRYPVAIIHAAGRYGWEVLEVPPLRERAEDLPLLVSALLARAGEDLPRSIQGIDEAAMSILMNHPWPGNVKELETVIRSAALATRRDVILPESLPPSVHEYIRPQEDSG